MGTLPAVRVVLLSSLCLALVATACQKRDAKVRDLQSLAPLTCGKSAPGPTPLRLLTRAEYDNTVADLLGDETHPSQAFAREPLSDGYDNDATVNRLTADSLKRFMEAAELVAARAVRDHRDVLVPCAEANALCKDEFIRTFGRRFFRRPLGAEEIASLSEVFADGSAQGGFDVGIEWTLAAMLLAPQFLYRDERAAVEPDGGLAKLTGYQLATRLSYFIWASAPDDALLDAAARGELLRDEELDAQVDRMLADPKADRGKLRFLSLWLGVDGVGNARKDEATYPDWTRALSRSWETSLELFLEGVIHDGNDVQTLLMSPALYANADMAIYTDGEFYDDFARFEPKNRVGLLAQPAWLAMLASPDQSSPVRRGVFVLDKLLCQSPGAPPAGANLIPPEPSTAATTRERFAQHAQADCAACHDRIDSVGFVFEHFDGIGQWRDEENGQPIDASGALLKTRDEKLAGPVNGVGELSDKLAGSGQVTDCISRDWLRFMLGRSVDVGDLCSLYSVQRDFAAGGGSFDALMRAVTKTDAFRAHAKAEAPPQ